MEQFVFHVPFGGVVDEAAGVIRDVSIMTGALVAEGHDLEVDETTLKQVLECAQKTGKIPVKLDHGSGIMSLCGYIDGATAKIDGMKVRGDWHLLKTHKEYATVMERATKMPECFGLSAAFKGKGEVLPKKKGKKAARCEKLLSVDCVTQPAANPGGLFSVPVDTRRQDNMADENTNTNTIPADAPEWAKQLFTKIDGIAQKQAAQDQILSDLQTLGQEPDLAELGNMTDAEIEAAGFDVAAVRDAVEAAIASGELTREGGDPAQQQQQQTNVSPNAAPGAPGGQPSATAPAGATAMSAKAVTEIVNFEIAKVRKQARDAAEEQEAEHAFSVIELKVKELSAKNDELVELNGKLKAENDSLRLTLKTAGVRAAAPGFESPTLFSAKGAVAGSFEQIVTAKFEELKTKAGMTEVAARSQATQFAVRQHPASYQEYLARGGKIELGK